MVPYALQILILKIQNPRLQVNVHPQILPKILVKALQK